MSGAKLVIEQQTPSLDIEVKEYKIEVSQSAGPKGDPGTNYLTPEQATDLTDNGETTLHYHDADRDRANHTGTQTAATISDFDTEVANNTAVAANTAKNSYPSADSTKVGHISVTQPVDLDTIESDTATNNAKVTNATHTGDVTGDSALTIAADTVTNAKAANMSTATIKGRTTAGTGDPEDLTAAQARAILNVADNSDNTAANETSHSDVVTFTFGSGAPTSTPAKHGLHYVDTDGDGTIYHSVGTSSSADWALGAVENTVDGQTIAGGAGTVGLAYYQTTTADTWLASDQATESTISGQVGICSAANTIMFSGVIPLSAHGKGANGLPLFVGSAGATTATEPTTDDYISRGIGYIEDADNIRVTISEDWFTIGTSLPDDPNVTTITNDLTVLYTHEIIEVDASLNDVTLGFPTAVGRPGKDWTVTRIDNSNFTVTIDPDGTETIQGDLTKTIAYQWTSVNIYSNGANLRAK